MTGDHVSIFMLAQLDFTRCRKTIVLNISLLRNDVAYFDHPTEALALDWTLCSIVTNLWKHAPIRLHA